MELVRLGYPAALRELGRARAGLLLASPDLFDGALLIFAVNVLDQVRDELVDGRRRRLAKLAGSRQHAVTVHRRGLEIEYLPKVCTVTGGIRPVTSSWKRFLQWLWIDNRRHFFW